MLCLTFSCNVGQRSSMPQASDAGASVDSLRYARGLTITRHTDFTVVELRDPWNEGRLLHRYLLVPRSAAALPEGMPEGTVVRTPLRRMVVYTSVHCALLNELGASDGIAGVCEAQYVHVEPVLNGLRNGTVADLGEATSPDIEGMIRIGADAILASPFQNAGYGPAEKIGLPIIECADYMESDPLGRAEWIRFLGLLTDREATADSLFRSTEAAYLRVRALTDTISKRPTLLVGKKYGSAWHVPNGASYMARMYQDAGADYVFRDLPGSGSTPLTFEAVIDRAQHADLWLIQYNADVNMTYASLRAEYTPYASFDAFAGRHIYGCNTHNSHYYEEIPLHPDRLLSDLIAIIHPRLLHGHKLHYFAPLRE